MYSHYALELVLSFAQEEEEKPKVKDKPVNEPFGSGILIDNQTCFIPAKKTWKWLSSIGLRQWKKGIHRCLGYYVPGANISDRV